MPKNKSYTFVIPDLHATRTWIKNNIIGATVIGIIVATAFALGIITGDINCDSPPGNQAGGLGSPSTVLDEVLTGYMLVPTDEVVDMEAELYWVTHYGPPTFVPADVTAWGMTLEESEEWAQQLAGEWGVTIDGICAAHRYTPWYAKNIYPPSLLKVEARGNYLVLDRKGLYDCVGVDIYEPDQDGPMYSYRGEVTEIVGWWCEDD